MENKNSSRELALKALAFIQERKEKQKIEKMKAFSHELNHGFNGFKWGKCTIPFSKMVTNQIHTVPGLFDGWVNKASGYDGYIAWYATKEEATKAGRILAIISNAEHFIHNENGQFKPKNSYGGDSFPPRG